MRALKENYPKLQKKLFVVEYKNKDKSRQILIVVKPVHESKVKKNEF